MPHSAQNSRVTGFGRSLRVKGFGWPFVYEKPGAGRPITALGWPPDAYWHSRQWHCPLKIGFPSAR